MSRPGWDFDYLPLRRYRESTTDTAHVVATGQRTTPDVLARCLRERGLAASAIGLLEHAPLHWYRLEAASTLEAEELHELVGSVVDVRYVAPATRGCLHIGEEASWPTASIATPAWAVHARRDHDDGAGPGFWFLGSDGVQVDRAVCGTGAGTRLAVIDDNARDADALELEREIPVGIDTIARSSSHGADMVAWATRSRGREADRIPPFTGVAPDASARLYCIPKAGKEVHSLPVAIVRAVADGADVIVCATYVEASTSPMLDDALEFAQRMGRGGLGTAVIFAAGREVSSPPGTVHASLTLALGDPACDPRVLCIAPSGRDGSWFLWTDRFGTRRPFSNRGPAVALAAPGDDMAKPHLPDHRIGHAESSGASAIAAGAALLVLGNNPDLRVGELYALLERTAIPCPPPPTDGLADPADVLPAARDPDGHDARCGYGRVSALRTCLAAMDPIAATLVALGDDNAAARWQTELGVGYSAGLARWAARAFREDPTAARSLRGVVRHLRLLSVDPERVENHDPGALCRALLYLLRTLEDRAPASPLKDELQALSATVRAYARSADGCEEFETSAARLARELWWRSSETGAGRAARVRTA